MSNRPRIGKHEEREHTLAIAGPKPFHKALTPSCAIVLRTQSMNPEYVPWGADWSRDLITCTPNLVSLEAEGDEAKVRTSGGIAIAHIATPAVPPAKMTVPRLSLDGSEPAGVRARFVSSYAAKYLFAADGQHGNVRVYYGSLCVRCASWTISSEGSSRSTEDAPQAALSVKPSYDVDRAIIHGFGTLTLYLFFLART